MKILAILLPLCFAGIFGQGPARIAPPSSDCNDEVQNPKFYQESCSNDTECFGGPSSMVCKDKKCQCAENFVPEERFTGETGSKTVCVPAPGLFSKCNATCQKPGVCQVYKGEGSDGSTKICICAQPFIFENGACYLSCKRDEVYDSAKSACVKRCKMNEIKVNETCRPIVDLKGACESDSQCQAPFSECKSKSCACRPGFSVSNSACVPKTVSCPFGEALKKGSSFVTCQILPVDDDSSDDDEKEGASTEGAKIMPRPSKPQKSDCAKGSFCMISTGDYFPRPGSTGYCCPKRPLTCPVGAPHPIAKCGGASSTEQCPWETHFCVSSVASGSFNQKQLCCPKTCGSELVQVGAKCLPRVNWGDACSSKEQCQAAYTDCVKGVCQCQTGAKQSGTSSYPYCAIECGDDEVQSDGKCLKRAKLGDTCTTAREYLCPEYGRCGPTKQCVCRCGAFTLADNICAPPPICRSPVFSPFPLFGAAGAEAKSSPELPPIPRISDEERDKLLKNVTFCKVFGKSAPKGVKISDKCASNQYCSQYITNVGLCCSKPEPFCPMGGGGEINKGKSCDTKDPLSCGLESSCFKYLYAVDQNEGNTENTVCCPKSPFVGGAPRPVG